VKIRRHWRRVPDGFESDLRLQMAERWFRVGLFYGHAPGSHMFGKHLTAWRTQYGDLHGINIRFGWWPRPCVTMLAHTGVRSRRGPG